MADGIVLKERGLRLTITKSNCPEWPRCGCGGQPCKLAAKLASQTTIAEWAERARDAIGDAQHLIHQGDFMTAVHALIRAAAACHEAEAAHREAER